MEQLALVFKCFDTDQSGSISLEELREKLTTCGDAMSNEEASELLKNADASGDGVISYDEFMRMPCWRY